jgi:predicted ferric reductase
MTQKSRQNSIIGLIFATTTPFLFLYFNLLGSDFNFDKFVFISANIAGFIGTILLVWNFVLGVRSVVSKFTPDIVWALNVHKWIGKYGVLFALAHPFIEMVSYLKGFGWVFLPDFSTDSSTFITIGRFSFYLLLVVYISSALLRNNLKYRPWKYIHNLSYPAMYFVFPHSINIGTYLNQYIALKVLWFTLLGLFVLTIIYRLVEWGGWFKPKYEMVSKSMVGNDIMILELVPKKKKINILSGQFISLQLKAFGETHPFSMMRYDEATGKITLGIKVFGRFTKNLNEIKIGKTLSITGPFGVFTSEARNSNSKVLLAGGIGVTPFVDLIEKFGSQNTYLCYAVRNSNQLVNHQGFIATLGQNYQAFVSDEAIDRDKNIVQGYIEKDNLQTLISKTSSADFYICGPKPFMKIMKDHLESLGVAKTKIHIEEFSY